MDLLFTVGNEKGFVYICCRCYDFCEWMMSVAWSAVVHCSLFDSYKKSESSLDGRLSVYLCFFVVCCMCVKDGGDAGDFILIVLSVGALVV